MSCARSCYLIEYSVCKKFRPWIGDRFKCDYCNHRKGCHIDDLGAIQREWFKRGYQQAQKECMAGKFPH
jgi:hypothetical protein